MRIALAQIELVAGDLSGNTERLIGAIRRARDAGCHLLAAPETAITGYNCGDLFEVPAFLRANKELLLQRVLPALGDMPALVGFVDFEEDSGRIVHRYSAAAAVQNGHVVAVAAKQHLCGHRYYDEPRYFSPGRGTTVCELTVGGRRLPIGVLICEDMWDAACRNDPAREAARAGARMLAVINASPWDEGKWQRRVGRIREIHRATHLPVLYATSVGIGDNLKNVLVFDGRSMAFDAAGRMVACAPALREDLLVFDLNDDLLGAPIEFTAPERTPELYDMLVFALRSYAQKSGFERAALGISGGVDSALCAAMACDAFGPQNVLGVSMPSRFNAPDSRADAEAVCRNLGMECAVIPIEDLKECVVRTLSAWRKPQDDLTLQNIQARLRGLILMGISNEQGRLIIATGNKTEVGTGYCTLYGDMAGGLELIGDVNKMQVYELAAYVNRRAGRDVIPRSVIARIPTAELTPGQYDPFDYPVVAPMVDDIIARATPPALVERFRARALDERYPRDVYERYDGESFKALAERIYRLYRQSAFKRAQAAPVVVVSSRAVGLDTRETIVNRWEPCA
jgi:NAD+ synthase (glutamine-hydrolysing)